jgi:predicted HTH transcriptional regulator
MNYILLRHGYPMIVIRTDDSTKYLKVLHQCDLLTGKIPFDGAHASSEQIKPLIDYIADITERKLIAVLQLVKGEIKELVEAQDDTVDVLAKDGRKKVVRKGGQKRWSEILVMIKENPFISRKELSERLSINPSAVQKHMQKLKAEGLIKRIGSDRGGHWEIIKE